MRAMVHSFVDESKDPHYLLVAALIRPAHITAVRRAISAFVLPGQRRIHFAKESSSRRGQIMGSLLQMPIEAVVYKAAAARHESAARRGRHPEIRPHARLRGASSVHARRPGMVLAAGRHLACHGKTLVGEVFDT